MPPRPTIITFDIAGRAQFTRGDPVAHVLVDDQFVQGAMLRVTDITMLDVPGRRRYMIKWLEGPFTNRLHSTNVYANIFGCAALDYDKVWHKDEFILVFPTYEAAVEHERECLTEMRRQGVVFS
jgi:hypothetical protein